MMSLRKIIFLLFVFIIIQFAILALIPSPKHIEYKESEIYSYHVYTDNDIKNVPRISREYHFTYDASNDEQEEMNSIVFVGGDLEKLREYLKGLGYYLSDQGSADDSGREEYWFSRHDGNDIFSLWYRNDRKEIMLTKILR